MKKTIVYILSTNYAGSHFLSLMLGSNTKSVHVGELKYLRKQQPKDRRAVCPVCEDIEKCPLAEGIYPENIDQVYDIIWPRFPGAEVLVDTSKRTFWIDRFLGKVPYDIKVIHLIRDPRGLIRRWKMNYETKKQRRHVRGKVLKTRPLQALQLAFADQNMIYEYQWLNENQEITNYLKKRGLAYNVVTYHDLAVDADGEMRRLTEWIGLDYEPAQLEYYNFEHHGSYKEGYEWIKEKKTFFDLRWQDDLSEREKAHVEQNRHVMSYLSSLDLKLTADGLMRTR
ncbi:MAG: sulfotransferase [Verrucomicrobia bacterium]|nr:sulfotransferase [Verrucomicrobiota bacterium]